MSERFHRKTLINHLKRFFGGSEEETKKGIDSVIEEHPDVDTGRLFFEISSEKGVPKSHASGKREGKAKNS